MIHRYNSAFYRYATSFATASAERIVGHLTEVLPIKSVVDFGCAEGAWLNIWKKAGASVSGVDGPYVDQQSLLMEADEFHCLDLTEPISLGRSFDLVQSLEVAEHLPPESAERFVCTLVRHGTCILFSAAVPGQGGEYHINERPPEYWRGLFRSHEFLPVDYLRPLLRDDKNVQYWYRYNTMLYVNAQHVGRLPVAMKKCLVPDDRRLANYWPLAHLARQSIVRQLPVGMINVLSRMKSLLAASRASGVWSL